VVETHGALQGNHGGQADGAWRRICWETLPNGPVLVLRFVILPGVHFPASNQYPAIHSFFCVGAKTPLLLE
jgi:hypothetical protein